MLIEDFFSFYGHKRKLSLNFLTALVKGHPPAPLPLTFSLPRPLSSSPFREAPRPTHPVLHSTGGGSSFNTAQASQTTNILSILRGCKPTASAATGSQHKAQALPRRALALIAIWLQQSPHDDKEKATVAHKMHSDKCTAYWFEFEVIFSWHSEACNIGRCDRGTQASEHLFIWPSKSLSLYYTDTQLQFHTTKAPHRCLALRPVMFCYMVIY